MIDPTSLKYVCIHGHFYQPPRENPWLEEIEREDSASPCHDWNERIHFECYRANAAAREVDEHNRVLSLCNNYRYLSFNFGPTLLQWIRRHAPMVYRAVVEADRHSCERFNGHGNAVAQVYSHMIMPLASRRDKVTQVEWGIGDFQHHFGRRPEGMWLAETAVDDETLQVLAEAGIRFTILSPYQACRWRFLDGKEPWRDGTDGRIPTGRPYLYTCANGKDIVLFFYNGAIARGVAFERLLDHSSRLVTAVHADHENRTASDGEPWLVHTATDGESYGHHFMFGDMALAAAFRDLEKDPSIRILNYGAFLAAFPIRAEVEILPNTAWSCAHGLGRWQTDCGCRMSQDSNWNQEWRTGLREALNHLRDSLVDHYQKEMRILTASDPWEVRNDYIEVVLDGEDRAASFARRFLRLSVKMTALPRFLKLLEMQRCAMLMFTSCGWFFDEISGLESVLILRYAARVLQLARQTGAAPSLERDFLKKLERAPSNIPEMQNGAGVYLKKVKPWMVGAKEIVVNYAIRSLARSSYSPSPLYCYDIHPRREYDLGPNPAPCLFGEVAVRDRRTMEEEVWLFAVIHFQGLDFRCSVKPCTSEDEYQSILEDLERSVEEQDTVRMVRVLDRTFGTDYFTLHDTFRDLRAEIAMKISQSKMARYTEFQRHLYQVYRPLILSLRQWNVVIPEDLVGAIKRVLTDEIAQLVDDILEHESQSPVAPDTWRETDFYYRAHVGRLRSLLSDARSWSVTLQLDEIGNRLGKEMVKALKELGKSFAPSHAGRLVRLMKVCGELAIKPELWELQTDYFEMVSTLGRAPEFIERMPGFSDFVCELDDFLGCLYGRLLPGVDSVPQAGVKSEQ